MEWALVCLVAAAAAGVDIPLVAVLRDGEVPDIQYAVDVLVGNPGQEVRLVLSTALSRSYLYSSAHPRFPLSYDLSRSSGYNSSNIAVGISTFRGFANGKECVDSMELAGRWDFAFVRVDGAGLGALVRNI